MRASVCGLTGAALIPLLAACTTTSPPGAGTGGAPPHAGAGVGARAGAAVGAGARVGAAPDATFDWHALVLLPFGASLNDSPTALHEVLLFHEAAQGSAGTDSAECYSVDAPPRFIEDRLRDYLLCFVHDRLNRIEASVELPATAAADTFARACALWKNSAVPAAAPAAESDGPCAGREGGIAFTARLDRGGGDRGDGDSLVTLSITLSPAAADVSP